MIKDEMQLPRYRSQLVIASAEMGSWGVESCSLLLKGSPYCARIIKSTLIECNTIFHAHLFKISDPNASNTMRIYGHVILYTQRVLERARLINRISLFVYKRDK